MEINIPPTSQDTLDHESTIGAFELSDAELATIQGASDIPHLIREIQSTRQSILQSNPQSLL